MTIQFKFRNHIVVNSVRSYNLLKYFAFISFQFLMDMIMASVAALRGILLSTVSNSPLRLRCRNCFKYITNALRRVEVLIKNGNYHRRRHHHHFYYYPHHHHHHHRHYHDHHHDR